MTGKDPAFDAGFVAPGAGWRGSVQALNI